MSVFSDKYALSGEGYDHWDEARTERELRLHLFEVGFRLERVLQNKGNSEAEKKVDKEELSKECSDLLILVKHWVLTWGGGEHGLGDRHGKFRRR